MSRKPKLIQLPLAGKIFLCVLAIVYQVYLIALVRYLYTSSSTPTQTIAEHTEITQPDIALKYWTKAHMRDAINADQYINTVTNLTATSVNTNNAAAVRQDGQLPTNGEASYPLSTVGKVFFTSAGQNYVCSGTAIVSSNHNTVDTAGHCLYLYGNWSENVIFCPLYDNGNTPYGCWAARETQVPSDWVDTKPEPLHHDFGMAIVVPNNQGSLTNMVGGAGWAYNQPADQPFYAYGYPAAHPFDGQTRQSCEGRGKSMAFRGGTVVYIQCNMTGGSSGGPWFIRSGDKWYLDGHNDFGSSAMPGYMFSPYYENIWYALYNDAQHE